MYIRSQNKLKIFKLDYLFYTLQYNDHCLKIPGDTIVGVYESDKKALEQLDNITAFLYSGKNMYELE